MLRCSVVHHICAQPIFRPLGSVPESSLIADGLGVVARHDDREQNGDNDHYDVSWTKHDEEVLVAAGMMIDREFSSLLVGGEY